jgi:CTP synthase
VINAPDASSIYEVPLIMEQEGLAVQAIELLNLEQRIPDLSQWQNLVSRMQTSTQAVKIALVGKYTQLGDAYLSVAEALRHGAIATGAKLEIKWINSEEIESHDAAKYLCDVQGIVVPGGFGIRGVDGKIAAIKYAREQRIPFLGLCLGMQAATIEWAQNIAKLDRANSSEFDVDTPNPVIALLPEQHDIVDLGGTMRLGLYPCRLEEGTLAHKLYQQGAIYERHRHRYEFNNAYRNLFLESGYVISGTSPDTRLVEIIERPDHPFFIATQFHPEFQSTPSLPHPLFKGFMSAALAVLGDEHRSVPEH